MWLTRRETLWHANSDRISILVMERGRLTICVVPGIMC
jgi:hypothetical protein